MIYELKRYIHMGFLYFFISVPLAIIIYFIISMLLFIVKQKRPLKNRRMLLEFAFVWYSITILNITGIIGMTFNLNYFKNSLYFSIPFIGSSIIMLFFNCMLFVPFGFFLSFIFEKNSLNGFKILIVGFLLSCIIEVLQMFGGRMSELDDIIMNSLGTVLGYFGFLVYRKLFRMNKLQLFKKFQ